MESHLIGFTAEKSRLEGGAVSGHRRAGPGDPDGMNGYRRVRAALEGARPDRVPVMLHNFLMAAREAGFTPAPVPGGPRRDRRELHPGRRDLRLRRRPRGCRHGHAGRSAGRAGRPSGGSCRPARPAP
ncbi:MAG: hypothetical protein MZU91_11380 [Desulfosudis oleivorans]|nr:hypothetical protein [Desulfosudis oleivorans]